MEQDIKLAESQVVYAKAELISAQAAADRVKIRSVELDAKESIAKADVSKEMAERELSQKKYERIKKLFDTSAATDEERENHELAVKVHQSSVDAAQIKLGTIKADRMVLEKDEAAATATVESAKGKVAIAEATVQRAKVLYNFTEIKVPELGLGKPVASAIVLKRFVSNGELIPGGSSMSKTGQQPLVTVVVNDPIRVIADIPEGESASVHSGTPVQALFMALAKDKAIQGTVTRVSPSIMANTRTLRIEMDVPNPDGKLRAGMMAYVEISTDQHKGVLAVPKTAVENGKRDSAVYRVFNGKYRRTPVVVGYMDHNWVEVRSEELTESTQIVKDLSTGVSDGAVVEISKPPVTALETAGK